MIKRVCNCGLFLEKGKMINYGNVDEVCALYDAKLGLSATAKTTSAL
jgi:ABC-type polysaccharide/polyol phosphate transport system ATPase subunit